MAIRLFDNDTGRELGSVNEEQLRFLIDHLEEETSDDRDYYLTPLTLELLAAEGADSELLGLLTTALGDRKGFEIRWQREE